MNSAVDRILRMVDLFPGSKPEDKAKGKTAFEARISAMLPAHIKNHQVYVTMFENVVNEQLKNKYVTKKESIIPCVFQAVKFALYPDPAMGQIYFIPYKGVLTYQLGYKGLIRLVLNAGAKDVTAMRVFQKEVDTGHWSFYRDEKGDHFHHEPMMQKDRGAEYCVYSLIFDADNLPHIHVMESYHVDEIKKMVLARMAGSQSPWTNELFEPEMRKKTCIRRHCKTSPMSLELATAIEAEETIERGETPTYDASQISDVVSGIEVPDDLMPQSAATKADDEFEKAIQG